MFEAETMSNAVKMAHKLAEKIKPFTACSSFICLEIMKKGGDQFKKAVKIYKIFLIMKFYKINLY